MLLGFLTLVTSPAGPAASVSGGRSIGRGAVRNLLRSAGEGLRVQDGRRLRLPALARDAACLYSCSASQVVQRVCFTSSPTIATTAWLVTRRSRGQ